MSDYQAEKMLGGALVGLFGKINDLMAKIDVLHALLREIEWVYDDSGVYYCATRMTCLSSSECDGYAEEENDGYEDTPTGILPINQRLVVKHPHAPDCRLAAALK